MAKKPVDLSMQAFLREATRTVEDELNLENTGWSNLSNTTPIIIDDAARIINLKLSRLYALKDPLGVQSIRLWTDYTFGSGMNWHVDEEKQPKTKEVLDAFWNSRANRSVLSPTGQREGSDKLLTDGEVFFAIFLGPESRIQRRN